jgi:hypothetical protein
MKISHMIWTLVLFFALEVAVAAEQSSLSVVKEAEGFKISENHKPVLFYQLTPKSQEGKFKRANYVHPLFSLAGGVLTEDFPKDHLHHRGVFWAWHTLTLGGEYAGDNWVCDDFEWDLQRAEPIKGSNDVAGVKTVWWWKSPKVVDNDGKMKAMVEETTTVRVFARKPHYRLVDFEIRLQALLDDVRMAGSLDDKGYGGFSVRMNRPKDMVFTGQIGEVKPDRLAVEGGAWMDMSGSLTDEGRSGVTILCHPSLPVYPQQWLLRMASQQNPQWPGNQPVLLPKGKDVVLRYRLVIHDDGLTAEGIEGLHQEYSKE